MLKIEKMETIERAIIYGCGNWGRKCISFMEKQGFLIEACCDSNPSMWGQKFEGYPVISPEELINNRKTLVIIAMERSEEMVRKLLEADCEISLFYRIFEEEEIYRIMDVPEILGCKQKETLRDVLLHQAGIYLVGSEKRRKDFQYLFDWIPVAREYETMEEAVDDENGFIIYCEKHMEAIQRQYEKNGLEIIGAEELFCLLGEGEETDYHAVIWALKTFYAQQENQMPCMRPFTSASINSNFELHFCCGDWSMGVGSILGEKSLEELWKSDLARIYRLSIINRTYSFCHRGRCVQLKPNPEKKEMERLAAGIHTAPVPLQLEIGIDKTCNLYCKSCRNQVLTEQGERKERIEKAKEIIVHSEWAEKCNVLLLGGQGEVFASRPYQEVMLEFTGRRNSLSLRSNGVLLDESQFQKLKEKYEKLYIIISVDAAKKETYNMLRRSHDKYAWDKLQKNLQMLSEKRRTNVLNFFQLNMCVQRDNYKEMADFVRMGDELGADKIYLTPIRNWGTYTEEEFEEIRIFDDEKKIKEEVQEELDKVRALSVKPVITIAF